MDFPAIGTRAFPGNRDEAYRAGITPRMRSGTLDSSKLGEGVGGAVTSFRMLPPEQDLADRRPIWNVLQMFWMDTDPEEELEYAARVCAGSKYSVPEIEEIFWNEV